MSSLVERALRLWAEAVPPGDAGRAAFATVYTDPLTVNGQPTALQVLVDRARMLQRALEGTSYHLHEQVEAPGRRAFAFRICGRHVGPLMTPLGEVAATGREVEIAGQDVFVVDENLGLVSKVWAVADYLDLLILLGRVELTDGAPTTA